MKKINVTVTSQQLGQKSDSPINQKPGCSLCAQTGYLIVPSANRNKSLMISLCSCVLSFCEKCDGDKEAPYMFYDEQENIMRYCACAATRVKVDKIGRLMYQSNIPDKFRYKMLNSFITRAEDQEIYKSLIIAHDSARHFLSQFEQDFSETPKGLFFFGAPGSGKTLLSCIILNELILRYQVSCKFIKITRDFFNLIRSTFNKASDSYGQTENIFKKIAGYDVLVIDDLGIQLDSNWEQTTLYDLIDYRYENQKLTIINSNFEPEEFRGMFEGRLYSRLKEMVDFRPIINVDFRDNFVE